MPEFPDDDQFCDTCGRRMVYLRCSGWICRVCDIEERKEK